MVFCLKGSYDQVTLLKYFPDPLEYCANENINKNSLSLTAACKDTVLPENPNVIVTKGYRPMSEKIYIFLSLFRESWGSLPQPPEETKNMSPATV